MSTEENLKDLKRRLVGKTITNITTDSDFDKVIIHCGEERALLMAAPCGHVNSSVEVFSSKDSYIHDEKELDTENKP